jgi:hypothetical protein
MVPEVDRTGSSLVQQIKGTGAPPESTHLARIPMADRLPYAWSGAVRARSAAGISAACGPERVVPFVREESVARSVHRYADPIAWLSSSARRIPSVSSTAVRRQIPPTKKMTSATILRRLEPVS